MSDFFRRVKLLLSLSILFVVAFGTHAAEGLVIRKLDGREVRPLEDEGTRAVVLFFAAHDCPVSNSFLPEMSRVAEKYGPSGVAAFLIYAEPDLEPREASRHCREYAVRMPVAIDATLSLAAQVGVKVTPEAVVIARSGKVVYRGRIDDTFAALGRRRAEPSRRDLRDALDALLSGKAGPLLETPAVGCFIPFKK